MKKVNRKLASAIVLGLMLAVPVGASAAEQVITGETEGRVNNSSVVTENDLVFTDGTNSSGKYVFGAQASGKDREGSLTANSITLDGWWQSLFYAGSGATLNINVTGDIKNAFENGVNPYGQIINAASGATINISANNLILKKNPQLEESITLPIYNYTKVKTEKDEEGNLTNALVDIDVKNNVELDGDWYVIRNNDFGTLGNANENISAKVDINAGNNIILNSPDGTTIISESYKYADKAEDRDYSEAAAGKTEVKLTAGNSITVIGGHNGVDSCAILARNGLNENDAKVILEAKNITVDGDIVADKNAHVKIGGDFVYSKEDAEGNAKSSETIAFNKADITGNITATNNSNVEINLGNNGSFTGSVNEPVEKQVAKIVDNSKVEIGLGNGSVWNLTGKSTVSNITGTGTINTNDLSKTVTVTNATSATLTVNGSGDIADAIYKDEANAQKLANVVISGEKSVADKVTTDEGIIAGRYSFDVDDNGTVVNGSYTKNTKNEAISNMASIGLMSWRAQNNDMNKRLGELRNSNGEHGVWARMVRGESEYGAQNVKNQYNIYQLGYDEKLSTNDNWTVGAAISYSEGNSSFENGSGEDKSTGFAVYGSYLGDNGEFVDLIAKYARLDNEFDVTGGVGSGDYSTNGYSFSAEYGKRNQLANGFYFEPQVELTYGRVADVDFVTDSGANMRQDAMNSLVGRVGFAAGKNIKNGNVYVRASYLYDFDGETNVTFSNAGASETFSEDLGGGWFEFGIGTNINLSDATYLYLDVEKTTGGEVDTNWQWNAGVRYSF